MANPVKSFLVPVVYFLFSVMQRIPLMRRLVPQPKEPSLASQIPLIDPHEMTLPMINQTHPIIQERRFCVNCIYHSLVEGQYKEIKHILCTARTEQVWRSLVTAEVHAPKCQDVRADPEKCGLAAVWFVEIGSKGAKAIGKSIGRPKLDKMN